MQGSSNNHNKRNRKKQDSQVRQERLRTDRGILGRTAITLILCGVVAFIPVVGMLLNLMVFRHEEYAQKALNNQTRVTNITASRGSIYDRNMNVLAASASVENVFLDPYELKRSGADINLIAATLSDILDVDADYIKEQAADCRVGSQTPSGTIPTAPWPVRSLALPTPATPARRALRHSITAIWKARRARSLPPRATMRPRCPIPMKNTTKPQRATAWS